MLPQCTYTKNKNNLEEYPKTFIFDISFYSIHALNFCSKFRHIPSTFNALLVRNSLRFFQHQNHVIGKATTYL